MKTVLRRHLNRCSYAMMIYTFVFWFRFHSVLLVLILKKLNFRIQSHQWSLSQLLYVISCLFHIFRTSLDSLMSLCDVRHQEILHYLHFCSIFLLIFHYICFLFKHLNKILFSFFGWCLTSFYYHLTLVAISTLKQFLQVFKDLHSIPKVFVSHFSQVDFLKGHFFISSFA